MHHNDTHEKSSGGFWSLANVLISLALALFVLLTGGFFILQGAKHSRWHGEDRLVITPEERPVTSPAPSSDTNASPPVEDPAATDSGAGNAAAAGEGGDVKVVVIKPGADNPMSFDIKEIKVKGGQKVKITFDNKSAAPLQHNLIIGAKDSITKLVEKANAMMSDMPTWMAKSFVPEGPEVLHATKLLNPGESQTLEFVAPKDAGTYPYLCTFPGHAAIMQGKLIIE